MRHGAFVIQKVVVVITSVSDGMAERNVVIAEGNAVMEIKGNENCKNVVKTGKITLVK